MGDELTNGAKFMSEEAARLEAEVMAQPDFPGQELRVVRLVRGLAILAESLAEARRNDLDELVRRVEALEGEWSETGNGECDASVIRLIPEPTDSGGGRGLLRSDFTDLNGESCSIQDSSLATEAAIWLGPNSGIHHMGECLSRMHLDRQRSRELGEMLLRFAETGSLVTGGDAPMSAEEREQIEEAGL